MSLNIVLVAPEIPQNTGAIGRLCVNLEARLHLIKPLAFSLEESKVKRAGLDYWRLVQLVVHEDWEAFLETEAPEQMTFLSTKGEQSLYDVSFEDGHYLVFGNETSGLPDTFYSMYKGSLFQIPMPGQHYRSLNLANAVAVAAYEAYRQLIS